MLDYLRPIFLLKKFLLRERETHPFFHIYISSVYLHVTVVPIDKFLSSFFILMCFLSRVSPHKIPRNVSSVVVFWVYENSPSLLKPRLHDIIKFFLVSLSQYGWKQKSTEEYTFSKDVRLTRSL